MLTFGLLGPLASALIEEKNRPYWVERVAPAPYRVWGEGLEKGALDQMHNATRLPVAVSGALMPSVSGMMLTPPLGLPHVQAGKVRALAYTGSKRAPFLPNVPTMAEAGVQGMEMDPSWYGVFAPAATPALTAARTPPTGGEH